MTTAIEAIETGVREAVAVAPVPDAPGEPAVPAKVVTTAVEITILRIVELLVSVT